VRGVLAAVLLAAATAPGGDLPAVEVQAGRVEVASLGLTSADVILHLVVANHTDAPLTLRELVYEAIVDGQPFKNGRVAGPVALPPRGAVRLSLPATVGYGEAGSQVLAVLRRGEVPYRVVGSVRVEGPRGARLERFDERGVVAVSGAR
jgi:LEA14-like dessication related protein